MTNEDKIAKAVEEAKIVPSHGKPLDDNASSDEDPCPVTALGTLDGNYYFIAPFGELRKLSPREFTDRFLVSLFAGRTEWLCRNFPAATRKGQKDYSRFEGSDAAFYLMRICHDRGLYNPNMPLRGPGVWRAGDLPILHTGDAIWYRNQWLQPGQKLHGAIYTARSALTRPDFKAPLSALEAKEIRFWFNAWMYGDQADADLLFGFMGVALLGGFPSWRAHTLATGERGIGKSKLGELIMACLGEQGMSLNDYTEAGLRQSLINEARAILLDEGEPGTEAETAHRMSQVIRLLRILSGGQGARIARGSSAGVAQNYVVTGCVMILAINPPPLEPQDRSRIVQISIVKQNALAEDVDYYIEEAARRSARLRARAILNADRFVKAFGSFRKLLLEHGCDNRQSDLYATVLAGRSLLLDDDLPKNDEALQLIELLRVRLGTMLQEDSENGDGQLCLRQLYDTSCDAIRDGRRMTLGQVIAKERQSPFTHDALLDSYGLRLHEGCLFVPHTHGQLARVYNGTRWASGGWRHSLMRLPGIKPSLYPVRVNGTKVRGLLVPPDLLPSLDTEPPQPP